MLHKTPDARYDLDDLGVEGLATGQRQEREEEWNR
jgi:hypothetical protein